MVGGYRYLNRSDTALLGIAMVLFRAIAFAFHAEHVRVSDKEARRQKLGGELLCEVW